MACFFIVIVALAGRPRIHVAVQPFVRAAEHCHDVHETASFNHISYVFCVMKVADRLNSDLFSSVSTLQITVFFDHRRSHHHHFLCVFRIPFRMTWTHEVQASILGYVRSLSTILPHYTLSASCFLCSSCWRKFALTPFARVGTCSFVCLLQQRVCS